MPSDDFFRLVRKRRSIRQFKPDPIPNDYVEKIIEAGRWAQSGANAQPWEFIVIKKKEMKDKIAGLWMEHSQRSWHIEKTRVKEMRHNHYVDGPPTTLNFKDAPVFIIVCGDPRTVQATVLITHFLHNEGGPMAHFLKNMGNATQIMNLAAAALGLGAGWVSVNVVTEARLKKFLNVPEELAIHTIVPVGYPAYEPPSPYRRDLKEIIHYEKYDPSKYRSGDDIYNFLLTLRQKTKPAYNR